MDLTDRTALVTGATSGIGRAIALELACNGASVIVSGRDAARGAETVAALQAAGGRGRFVAADLSDLESVANLAAEASDAEVLVNNAGTFAFLPTAIRTWLRLSRCSTSTFGHRSSSPRRWRRRWPPGAAAAS